MRHLRAFTTVAILLGLLLAGLWQARFFFLQNKVTFLLNQKQFEDATALVSRLSQQDPHNHRTQFLQIKTMTLNGNYREAAKGKVARQVIDRDPEVLYWQSLANWQLSNDQQARQLAQSFLDSGETLPDQASMLIAQSLAGRKKSLPDPASTSHGFRLLFPVEQAVYLAIVSKRELELGRVEKAAELAARAFGLGNRNNATLLNGAEASAIAGTGGQAEMLLAFSGSKSVKPLYEKLLTAYEQSNAAARTIHDQDVAGRGGRLDLARALSWAATAYLSEDVTGNMYPVLRVMAELQQEYPYDRVITIRMAVVLETLERYNEAYSLYRKLYLDAPNLVVGLRMWALEALPEPLVTDNIKAFMEPLEVLDVITTQGLAGDGFATKSDFIVFDESGSADFQVKIAESGSYTLTFIARGDKAGDNWPLVKVMVDNEFVKYVYVRREAWDCYSLDLILDSGAHAVEFEYVNGDTPAGGSEMRTLSLRSIYVTKPGAV